MCLYYSDDIDSTSEERRPELFVECLLYIDGAPFGLPMRTRFSFHIMSVDFIITILQFFFNFLNLGLINISWKSHKRRLESLGLSYCWNELITLSTKYRDLTANSQLAVTVSHPSYFWNLLIIFVNNLLVYSVLKLWELGFYLLYKIM